MAAERRVSRDASLSFAQAATDDMVVIEAMDLQQGLINSQEFLGFDAPPVAASEEAVRIVERERRVRQQRAQGAGSSSEQSGSPTSDLVSALLILPFDCQFSF